VTHSLFKISSVYEFFSAMGSIFFAFCGQVIWTEIMYEMRDPTEFETSLNFAMVTIFVIVTSTGVLGWYLIGDDAPAYLMDVIPSGSMRTVGAFFVMVHLILAILPKTEILIRVLHHKLDAGSVNAFHPRSEVFWRGTRTWFFISILLYLGMFLFMNTIPFFEDLVVLLGSLFEPTISIIIPAVLFWYFLLETGRRTSVTLKISWFFGAVLIISLIIFGTSSSLSDWVKNNAKIWTCNP